MSDLGKQWCLQCSKISIRSGKNPWLLWWLAFFFSYTLPISLSDLATPNNVVAEKNVVKNCLKASTERSV